MPFGPHSSASTGSLLPKQRIIPGGDDSTGSGSLTGSSDWSSSAFPPLVAERESAIRPKKAVCRVLTELKSVIHSLQPA